MTAKPAKATKPATTRKNPSGGTWVDPLRFHDDIRLGTARYRPITTDHTHTDYTISLRDTDLRFVGPTLYAATETARIHHQQLYGSDHLPIYTRRTGIYTWWDGLTTDTNDTLARRTPLYVARIYDVALDAVTITGPPPPPARRRATRRPRRPPAAT